MSHTSFLHLNDTSLPRTTAFPDYDNESLYFPVPDEHECLYEETQLERARYEEEGFYDLEVFTHYLSGFGGLSLAIVGLVLNSFCAFTLCRAAVFRAHLVFLTAVAIADALQLSCLIVIITRDIRQPDPRYLNLLPRIYIRAFLYLYPLSKFFHLAMAWFVMASTVDCWRWIKKAQQKEEKLRTKTLRGRLAMLAKSGSSNSQLLQPDFVPQKENRARCKVIITEILALTGIALVALVYTIPAAWENKGDILLLGKIGTDTNCSAFIYHLMQTDLSQTALYRIGYSLLGHLIFQTGIPLVVSSIAIAKISRQLQLTSTSLGQLVTDAVQIVMSSSGGTAASAAAMDRPIPHPTFTQRTIVENRNIIHCSLFLSVFTFYVCHVPQLWAKIQWSLMHVESHQNSHMKYVNEFVNFMTVANAAVNGFFILCFCRRYIADGARDIDMCAWCFTAKDQGGGLCSRGHKNSDDGGAMGGSTDDPGEEPIQEVADQSFLDHQDEEVDLGIYPTADSANLSNQPQPLRSSLRTPMLNNGVVSTISDSQYASDDYPQQLASQPGRHHHRRNHHNSRYSSYRQSSLPPYYAEYDPGPQQYVGVEGISLLPPPVQFLPQQTVQSPPQHQEQYFTMGPNDDDVYIAAQV